MQLSRKTLTARWAWTTAAAIVLLVILNVLDGALKAKTGYGTTSLQGIGSGWGVRVIVDHWTSPPDAALAGFLLGLDFLFIPLYGAALFYGALAAVDRFAAYGGRLKRILTLLALAPVGAAICDAIENVLQLYMLTHASTDIMASFALEATAAKWLGILIGVLLSLAALVGRIIKKRD
ncbi:hypothetical protein [Rhizomicrobium electricum]|uniref:Uncharacterized protein n=1 Tax=Rhizomicrobium electricum TaxID=480070 RepID=A0ABP3Q289_9PROT|nr:hypothetical protein [Rhizomicrobium electricum]NIJ49905.1 hypothetical protein [Rhizomicrobium electricum]